MSLTTETSLLAGWWTYWWEVMRCLLVLRHAGAAAADQASEKCRKTSSVLQNGKKEGRKVRG